MKTLSAQFDEMIIFGGMVVLFFYKILEVLQKNQTFSIYYVIFSYFIADIRLTMSFLCLYVLKWSISQCFVL